MKNTKEAFLTVRLPHKAKQAIHEKARLYGRPSDVVREILEAFVENRLVIKAPENRKENLYVD